MIIHDNEVDERNTSFKNDLVRKNNTDTMVVRLREKIDEQVLYTVKRVMSDLYSENLPLEETKLKDGVVAFFTRKKEFLTGLKQKYNSDYAGCSAAVEIYKDFDAILHSSDTSSIFQEIINRKDSLEGKAETLEQLEAFYKEGSNQQKNYKDAKDICQWYDRNKSLQDLSSLEDIAEKMREIVSLDMPFTRMNELANLVFQASTIKGKVLKEKLEKTKSALESDRDAVNRELGNALQAKLTTNQKTRIQNKADEVLAQYKEWFGALSIQTENMDSYITASANTLSAFRRFILSVMNEGDETPVRPVRAKRVRIIDSVPTVNRKLKKATDVDVVLNAIRKKLLAELKNNDEIDLE